MQETGLIKLSSENTYLKFIWFSQITEWAIPDLSLELLSECVEGRRLQWLVTAFLHNQMQAIF